MSIYFEKTKQANGLEEGGSVFLVPKDVRNMTLLSHLDRGVMYLNGPVNEEMAAYVRESLMLLTNEPPKEGKLSVKISSIGGDVQAGLEIHDLFMIFSIETGVLVEGLVIGEACSAASTFLLQGCGYRVASENSTIMIHNAFGLDLVSGHNLRSAGWIQKRLREFDIIQQKMVRILTRRTGRTEKEILKMLPKEMMMTAEEAKEFGLIDDVLEFTFKKPEPEKPRRTRRIPNLNAE